MKKSIITCLIILLTLFSCEKSSITNNEPLPLIVLNPNTSITDTPLDIKLEWSNPNIDSNEYLYSIYIAKTEDEFALKENNIKEKHYSCSELDLDTEYKWKVSGTNSSGKHTESEIRSFTTTSNLPSVIYNNIKLYVFPYDNACEYPDSLTFQFRLDTSGASSLHDGEFNTQKLISDYSKYSNEGLYIAANYCSQLDAYGYSDWYLPSIYEIATISDSLNLIKPSNSGSYWSSTERSSNEGYIMSFLKPFDSYNYTPKYLKMKFRCIRKD